MWVIDSKGRSVACLPKVAGSSIRSHFKSPIYTNEEVKAQCKERFFWIKHPITRLVSNYSFRKAILESGGKIDIPEDAITCYESFIDYTFLCNDPHWNPQTEQLSIGENYIPTHTYQLEELASTWGLHFRGFLPHINGVVHEPAQTRYRYAEILNKYQQDFDKWESV